MVKPETAIIDLGNKLAEKVDEDLGKQIGKLCAGKSVAIIYGTLASYLGQQSATAGHDDSERALEFLAILYVMEGTATYIKKLIDAGELPQFTGRDNVVQ